MFDRVIKNGKLFLDNNLLERDLAINGEKIAAIGSGLKGHQYIDAQGNWVLPGAIDVHTHFSLPFANAVSADNFYTGSIAAAAGGVTTFIDFTAQKSDEGLFESLALRKSEAENEVVVDFSLHSCIKNYSTTVQKELKDLRKKGVDTLKIFMAYSRTGMMQDDYHLLQILQDCAKCGITLMVHAENGVVIDGLLDSFNYLTKLPIEYLPKTRPEYTEVEAIKRLAYYTELTGCRVYVVHVSTAEGASVIDSYSKRGIKIFGETCPQYLYLDDTKLTSPNGHYFSCCPPLRAPSNNTPLWKNVNKALKVVSTDHCPFTIADKNTWNENINTLPMGLPGVQTLPQLVLNGYFLGLVTLPDALNSITKNPAKIFGLYPQKGSLLPGTDADIMIFDPNIQQTIRAKNLLMNTDYSPYEGLDCQGKNIMTLLRGKVIYTEQTGWIGQKGDGKFIERAINNYSGDFYG